MFMAGLRKRGLLTTCTSYVTFTLNIYITKTFTMREGSLEREDELPFLMKSLT